ncbi:autophagy-related protein 2 [Thecaphora frezii]
MASYFLPSFLSGWELPSISAAYSLSNALQRRILSYLLRRTLGHLVKGGQVDLDQIETGLGLGKIEIKDVELDAEAINRLLPSAPFQLKHGCLGLVQIQLPLPNLWNGHLGLTVSNVAIEVEPAPASAVEATASTLQDVLSSSFLSAASEILDNDEEGRAIEESIHQSLLAEDVNLDHQVQHEVEAGSIVTSIVESLLARIKVSLRSIRVDVVAASVVTLKLTDIDIDGQATEASDADVAAADAAAVRDGKDAAVQVVDEIVKVATVRGLELLVSSESLAPASIGQAGTAPSSEETNVHESGPFEASLKPTTSVPGGFFQAEDASVDLSASVMSEAASSLYESALDERHHHESSQEEPNIEPAKPAEPAESSKGEPLLLSIGAEPLTIVFKMHKEKARAAGASRPKLVRVARSNISLHVNLGHLAGFVETAQLCSLLALAELMIASREPRTEVMVRTPPPSKPASSSKETHLDFRLSAKSLNVIFPYEGLDGMTPQQQDQVRESIKAFWSRPSRSHPEIGHLRVKIDGIDVAYRATAAARPPPASIALTVADFGVFEHLPPSMMSLVDSDGPKILPILILDHNMARTTEPSTPTHALGASAAIKHNGLPILGPSVEAIDWRVPVHSSAQPASSSSTSLPTAHRGTRFAATPEERRSAPAHGPSPYIKTAYGERGWKVRPAHRRTNSNTSDDRDVAAPKAIDVTAILSTREKGQQTRVAILPIHIFLDVSLVTRILPSIKRIGAALRPDRLEPTEQVDLSFSSATISPFDTDASPRGQGLLEDLGSEDSPEEGSALQISTDAIRLELRVPRCNAGRGQTKDLHQLRQERALGLETRCGLFVLEAKSFEAAFGGEAEAERRPGVRFAPTARSDDAGSGRKAVGRISTMQIAAFHKRAGQGPTRAFACIGSIADPELDILDRADTPWLPYVEFLEKAGSSATARSSKQSQVDCCLPSVHVCLDKETIDAIQFLADDLTQWPTVWTKMHLDDSDSLDGEGLKLLGSRFFGTRAGLSVMSSSTDSTATVRKSASAASMSLRISEAVVRLKISPDRSSGRPSSDLTREMRLHGSEIACRVESDRSPNSSLIVASVLTFSLACVGGDITAGDVGGTLIGRTTEPGLTRAVRPMFSLNFESFSEPGTSYRESSIDIALSFVTLKPPMNTQLVEDVRALLRAPEGVFEHVEPNEVTRLAVKVRDCSVLVGVPEHSAQAALSFGDVSVKTKITSHAPKTAIKLAAADINLFAIDDSSRADAPASRGARSAAEHWNSQRFARILALSECKASVTLNSLTRPDVDVKVTKVRSKVYLCADTIAVLTDLVGAVSAALGKKPEHGSDAAVESVSDQSIDDLVDPEIPAGYGGINLLDSLDEDAFRRASPMDSVADLVNDDVPSDPSFLGETSRYHPEIVETLLDGSEFLGGDSVASLSIAPTDSGNVVFADDDVTIRILDPNGIGPLPEYFTDPDLTARSRPAFKSSASSVRVRVTNLDFSLRLHAGYDWFSTRQAIEDEARKVRRRLQKIKQLLAEGQTPDDSVEAATSELLDSVHIALQQDLAEMDPAEMIKAMDEGLVGDHSETNSISDAGTWQPIPGLVGGGRAGGASSTDQRKRSKLHRSRRSMIDFNFKGVEAEFDLLDAVELHLSSRIAVTADTFEIIDNIKTSTWHAFLTRMKVKEAAFRRDRDARMVRAEILNLRAKNSGPGGEEVRVRAKIEPLRLHVDQDALDFLKRFFAFKLPNAPPVESAPSSQPAKPFIQYAEVYPVKLKLDYKPKRVDYGLLKEGKTIELMNFFHFEGAEMTLRHITLRGINGWPRLFESFNDIWTPDVKANQLADVLSGVAPIRSLVNVGAGVADLVLLPIEQYQKDKRIIRGVQRGATSFAKTTALEAVRLGARLATGTQVILEQAEHILGGKMSQPLRGEAIASLRAVQSSRSDASEGSASQRRSSAASLDASIDEIGLSMSLHASELEESGMLHEQISRYADQPEDIKEALAQAYVGLSKGLTSAAQTILAVPMEVYEGGAPNGGEGGGGVARPVVKAVPIAVLRGARGATEAFAKTLMGVQAQLGENESNHEGKYKRSSAATSSSGLRSR